MATQYRTDQVGSLIRPPELLDARDAYKAGRIDREELRRVEDAAILDALEKQRQIGIEIFTDGEMRRDAWQTDIMQAVEGFADEYPIAEQRLPDGSVARVQMHTKPVRARLRQTRRLTAHEVQFLTQHAPGPFKVTMPAASFVAGLAYQPGVTDQAYPSPEELQQDVVALIRGEMQALVDDGVSYVQLDEGFVRYVSEEFLQGLRQAGRDPERALEADIAAENACYDAVPRDRVTVAMHVCRGNRVRTGGVGSYDWLAERLFGALHVDRFLLEYDSERAGSFEPLRFLPKGKTAVLGLVTTKDGRLESQDDLLRRIEEAARYCPIDQLALSPQCGFQSAAMRDGAFMTMDEQWRKLELVVDTARKVWGTPNGKREG
jgi:5-methyltetrahydropteroyltriglutamate--homocysteine methyltransferase